MVDEAQLEKQQRAKKGFIRAFGMFGCATKWIGREQKVDLSSWAE